MTPVKVHKFINMLKESNYNRKEVEFLEEGFTKGFSIGYQGPVDRASYAQNLPFTVGNKTILWNKLMKEVGLKRVAGPYKEKEIPFKNFIQSPIGLVPKDGNQTRLIFHLSYDCKMDGFKSVNACTPKEQCSVKYKDLDHAVHAYLRLSDDSQMEGQDKVLPHQLTADRNPREKLMNSWRRYFDNHKSNRSSQTNTIFASKSDLKSAFRLLGLSRESWPWLLMKAQDPQTGEWKYFIDKCLPFGASISCAHFQRFSNALCHLTEYLTQSKKGTITNYLDDFLFIALTLLRCNSLISTFLKLCDSLGIPVSMNKTEWGSIRIVFLGIMLDGESLTLGIPLDKRVRAISMLQELIDKKKTTVKQLQRLCGFLNFLGKAVFPRRTFTRRMYAKYSQVMNLDSYPEAHKHTHKLKAHHYVRLDGEFKSDCKVWLEFLTGDLHKVVSRPMVDLLGQVRTSKDIFFYSDASAAQDLGYGCLLNTKWLWGSWETNFIKENKPSIEFLELFALCAGILAWHDDPSLNNCRISIFCDNQAVVHMINKMSSSCG